MRVCARVRVRVRVRLCVWGEGGVCVCGNGGGFALDWMSAILAFSASSSSINLSICRARARRSDTHSRCACQHQAEVADAQLTRDVYRTRTEGGVGQAGMPRVKGAVKKAMSWGEWESIQSTHPLFRSPKPLFLFRFRLE